MTASPPHLCLTCKNEVRQKSREAPHLNASPSPPPFRGGLRVWQ